MPNEIQIISPGTLPVKNTVIRGMFWIISEKEFDEYLADLIAKGNEYKALLKQQQKPLDDQQQ